MKSRSSTVVQGGASSRGRTGGDGGRWEAMRGDERRGDGRVREERGKGMWGGDGRKRGGEERR